MKLGVNSVSRIFIPSSTPRNKVALYCRSINSYFKSIITKVNQCMRLGLPRHVLFCINAIRNVLRN